MPDVAIRIFCDAMHRAAHIAAGEQIPTGLTALGMTKKATLPPCHCEERQRRGNPYLLRCDASRGSHSRRGTDSHGPYGPRNDMADTTLPHWSYSSINGKLDGCLRSRPIVF